MTMQRGLGAIADAVEHSGGASYFKINPNEEKIIRFLTPVDQLISVYEHVEEFPVGWRTFTCLGKDQGCPLCAAGLKPSFQTYIPIVDKSDNNKIKILKAGVKMGAQILGLVKEYGDITKRDFKIQRIGVKFNTQYLFYAKDPTVEDWSKVEIPDIVALVQPKDPSAIQSAMAGDTSDVSNNASANTGFNGFAPTNYNQAPANNGFAPAANNPFTQPQPQQQVFNQPAQQPPVQQAPEQQPTQQAPVQQNKYPF